MTKLVAKPTGPFIGRTRLRLLVPVFRRILKKDLESFRNEIENDYLEHSQTLESEAELNGEQIRQATA